MLVKSARFALAFAGLVAMASIAGAQGATVQGESSPAAKGVTQQGAAADTAKKKPVSKRARSQVCIPVTKEGQRKCLVVDTLRLTRIDTVWLQGQPVYRTNTMIRVDTVYRNREEVRGNDHTLRNWLIGGAILAATGVTIGILASRHHCGSSSASSSAGGAASAAAAGCGSSSASAAGDRRPAFGLGWRVAVP